MANGKYNNLSATSKHKTQGAVRISIVTVSYNAVSTIARTIRSVMEQTYRCVEHIIIDGSSSDGTQDIIHSYQNAYAMNWISEPDHGISDALNKGLRLANGDYILVLQADDRLYHANSLASAVTFLEDQTCDLYTSPVLIETDGEELKLAKPLQPLWCHRFKTPFRHQGTLVHRRIFERIGYFSERFSIAMDYDFFYRAVKLMPRIVYDESPLSVMGGGGVGSHQDMVRKRIDEEYLVQRNNEISGVWRILQDLFRMVYLPYKVGAVDFAPLKTMVHPKTKKVK